jgi:hypothetical protein
VTNQLPEQVKLSFSLHSQHYFENCDFKNNDQQAIRQPQNCGSILSQGKSFFSFPKHPTSALGPKQLPTEWVLGLFAQV